MGIRIVSCDLGTKRVNYLEKELYWLKEVDLLLFKTWEKSLKDIIKGKKGKRNIKAKRMRFSFIPLDAVIRKQVQQSKKNSSSLCSSMEMFVQCYLSSEWKRYQ
ncbi:hypothetical protein ABET51_08620 [Metabacillus fastidiosus]|uniref:hypothetical protein n=1 Tax=Metabacillus fastidiosus TaxID=1458 RepID=UPI003D28C1CE